MCLSRASESGCCAYTAVPSRFDLLLVDKMHTVVGMRVQMHYLAQLLQKVDIEVEMDKALQEQAEQAAAAAAAESLGSLELPQGRPSPSDGPTRQDDIAGPLFPARPPTVASPASVTYLQ